MLKNAGLDIERHATDGIEHEVFSKAFRKSCLIKNKEVTWIAFNARFDYGYLSFLVDMTPLPFYDNQFIRRCSEYFQTFFDVKLLRDDNTHSLKSQLEYEKLPLPLNAHQAGSDSLCTLRLFFRSLE